MGIRDKRVIKIISQMLKAGYVEKEMFRETDEGFPQFAILSPLLSNIYHSMNRRINNTALAVWRNLYPKTYNKMQVSLKQLCNLPQRHAGYESKTFALKIEGKWFGITLAFITHSKYEKKPFDQQMTPYTKEGRKRYRVYLKKYQSMLDRPSINTPEDVQMAVSCKGKYRKYNFEYFMNREYAYNRDKGKCKCCGKELSEEVPKHCHHIKTSY